MNLLRSLEIFFYYVNDEFLTLLQYLSVYPLQVRRMGQTKRKNI